jgi:hypothetical protein
MTTDQARNFVKHLDDLPASHVIRRFNKGVQTVADAAAKAGKLAAKAAKESGALARAGKLGLKGGKLAKAIPGVGVFFAVAGWGVDGYCKGPGYGTLNSGIDAIPFVGGGKIVVELFTGDFIPNLPDEEEPFVDYNGQDNSPLTDEDQTWIDEIWSGYPKELCREYE